MRFEEVEKMVIDWAKDRGIFEHSDIVKQLSKLEEEFNELKTAILSDDYIDELARIKDIIDAIGDMMVVQTLISHFLHTDLFTCYASAYIEIKDRKGKMINGVFVKES